MFKKKEKEKEEQVAEPKAKPAAVIEGEQNINIHCCNKYYDM